jgi:membrane associated rhomboid family serine protease
MSEAEEMREAVPEDFLAAGVYATEREAFQHGLVILAMGYSYWLEPADDGGWRLMVNPKILAHVRYQLSRYERESHGWPPPGEKPFRGLVRRMEFTGPLLWALLTAGLFWAQKRSSLDFEALGCLDSRALFQGLEAWRPLTALFLHADIAHLLANLASGLFLFATLFTEFRRFQGWLLLASGAYLANVASAAIHLGEDYHSIGASTAVFTALGLLTGRAMGRILRASGSRPWRVLLIPFASGAGLLALFGSGGLRTDLTAHLTGFLCGLVLGITSKG